jgi:DHA1 family tetracycline resistance protein-like MFS transporter
LKTHPLIRSLLALRGNARASVYTEPLWGIPFNLYSPYISVYMLALGVTDTQIGMIASIGFGFQIITALLSGAITDKLGRKRTTLIFDLLSWSVPVLIWAVAQNFYFFVAAAIVNSLWRVTLNSWTCLTVEDADQEHLLDIYAWIYISGQMAVFFAPIAGILITQFSLVPTMRGLYLLALVMMTAKIVVMNAFVKETQQGTVRMQESRHQNLFSVLNDYPAVLRQILRTPATLYTMGIMLVTSITSMIGSNFWAIIVTQHLHIPEGDLALYPFARSALMMLFFFVVQPRIKEMHYKLPMVAGFGCYLLSYTLLVILPEKSYWLLLVSVLLEASGFAMVGPLLDKMVVVTVDPKERARILSILYVVVIVLTSPFGWIAGTLSSINRVLPFFLSMSLFIIGAILTWRAARLPENVEVPAAL